MHSPPSVVLEIFPFSFLFLSSLGRFFNSDVVLFDMDSLSLFVCINFVWLRQCHCRKALGYNASWRQMAET